MPMLTSASTSSPFARSAGPSDSFTPSTQPVVSTRALQACQTTSGTSTEGEA